MHIRNALMVIFSVGILFIQACSTNTTRFAFIHAFTGSDLKDSDIAWVKVGDAIKENVSYTSGEKKNYKIRYPNRLEIHFYEKDVNTIAYGNNCIALPSGSHKFLARYYYGYPVNTVWSDWIDINEHFEGGKCYEIYAQLREYDGGAYIGKKVEGNVTFKTRETNCAKRIWNSGDKDQENYKTLVLYKLKSTKKKLVLERKGSFDLLGDEALSPYRTASDSGYVNVWLPFDFINQLYRDLDDQQQQ